MCSSIYIAKFEFLENPWHFCYFRGLGFCCLNCFSFYLFFFCVGKWNHKTQAAPSWNPAVSVNAEVTPALVALHFK